MAAHSGLDVANLHGLAIVGAAPEGQRLARICQDRGIEIAAVVDDDQSKRQCVVVGLPVTPVQTLANLQKSTPVVIASHRVLGVVQRVRGLGFTTVVPFATLQVLAPDIFRPHMFYERLLDDLVMHRAEIQALHDRLADDRSRQCSKR